MASVALQPVPQIRLMTASGGRRRAASNSYMTETSVDTASLAMAAIRMSGRPPDRAFS